MISDNIFLLFSWQIMLCALVFHIWCCEFFAVNETNDSMAHCICEYVVVCCQRSNRQNVSNLAIELKSESAKDFKNANIGLTKLQINVIEAGNDNCCALDVLT